MPHPAGTEPRSLRRPHFMRQLVPSGILFSLLILLAQTTIPTTAPASHDPRYKITTLLYSDDFHTLSADWKPELEKTAAITAKDNILTLDTAAGLTLWLTKKFDGPLLITYDVRAIKATPVGPGGGNDRVSDLNCFWMATDSRTPADLFATKRTGKFSDDNPLLCYYASIGGNNNSTTRFRRYIGDTTDRPLLKDNDRRDPADMLVPNEWQTLQLVADDHLIQFFRNDKKLFEITDDHPYTTGHFAFRTTRSHLEIRNFKIFRLENPH